jgi:Zn-dependent peptidase ImmA (M78 family)
MSLGHYKPCQLEQWINTLYQHNGIYTPHDLDIERVSGVFNTDLMYYLGPSFADWREGGYSVIFLNQTLSLEETRAVFFHELCHPVRHVGDQAELPRLFAELQEIQAGLFQLYAALPFYMIERYAEQLKDMNMIPLLAYEFHLPAELIERRLNQIAARIHKVKQEQQMIDSVSKGQQPGLVTHSPETLKMLNKLLWISAQKGRRVFRGE